MAKYGSSKPKVARVDSDGQIKTGQGVLWAVKVIGGTALTTIALYDNTGATGDPIFEGAAPINSSSPLDDLGDLGGIPFDTGLYGDITTTGGSVYVWYT